MVTIEDIYKIIGELRQVFMGIAGQYVKSEYKMEDAVQELNVKFLTMNPDTLKKIYKNDGRKGLIRYGAVVLRRDFTSTKSSYYYTYRRYYSLFPSNTDYDINCKSFKETEETNNTWELYEQMDLELDKLYWYDREVYKLYYNPDKKETLDTLAKKTGISRNSLFTTIDNVRKKLKKVLGDE
tara:strand:+ start:2549 stop:3094 length:546 start_codon:yes stop_codon:yes gene_type:complete